jgi:hypothetical protein
MNNTIARAKAKEVKQIQEAHECEVCEPSRIENVRQNTIKEQKLPFGIESSQLNKYIVYGEILATPACRKQRKW